MKRQPKTAKRKRWGSNKRHANTPATTQLKVSALYLSGKKHREISRELGIDRETVSRILSQEEAQLLVHGFRSTLMKMVPEALITVHECVKRLDRQAAVDVLRGARVMVDRHEVENIPPPVQDYSYSRIRFFGKYKRWPTDEEAAKFQKTIVVKPTVKGVLTE